MAIPKEEEKKETMQDATARVAQDIVDKKVGLDWVKGKGKHSIPNKNSFAILLH
jgi:hypothetical protein